MMRPKSIYSKKGHGNWSWSFFFIVLVSLLAHGCHRAQTLPLTDADYAADTLQYGDSIPMVRPWVVDGAMSAVRYTSQMDADTALLSPWALAGTTSRARFAHYQSIGKASHLEVLCPIEEQWALMVCGRLRARKVKDLKGLTVAIARQDASDVLLTSILRDAHLEASAVYRPQINDLSVRMQMMQNGQVDAAMLPQPYAQRAREAGHRIIKLLSDTTQSVLLIRRDATEAQRDSVRKLLNIR